MRAILKYCLLFASLQTFILIASGQSDSKVRPDTAKKSTDLLNRIESITKKAIQDGLDDLTQEKAAAKQNQIFEAVKNETQKAATFLKNGIDTNGFSQNILRVRAWEQIAADGVFTNKGTAQTYRNLSTTNNLLLVLLRMTQEQKSDLDLYQKKLTTFQFQIDSISTDTVMSAYPKDSVAAMTYFYKIRELAIEITPIDSSIRKAISSVEKLQSQTNVELYKLSSSIDEIEQYQLNSYANIFHREFSNIWDSAGYTRSLNEIFRYSYSKNSLTLFFYCRNNMGKLLLMIALIFTSATYLLSLRRIVRQKNKLVADYANQLVLKFPAVSATMLVLNLCQFIFISPPFVFSCCIWFISCFCLSVIFHESVAKFWLKLWLSLIVIFFIACLNNLVLQASRIERWGMLVMAAPGFIYGGLIISRGKRSDLKESAIIYSVGLMALLEFLSFSFNLYGRYNLSKSLLISGYLNVIIGVLFLWTVRFINQGLSMAFDVYNGPDRKLFFINFKKVGGRAPAVFYILLVIGWLILFGRNFYAFTLIAQPVRRFLVEERHVGDYGFSIYNLVSFIGIMAISVAVSKLVSFFASDRHRSETDQGQTGKGGIGSWLLLVRISIISLGLFFAFAAAGLPMDRVAIVIGALGVGIGFGMQTIVNNLVSGLILAFEKQLNVGDHIEIGGQSGTVKSIGFRSSVIVTADGANVIMPNGDLLNAHLVNWSLGGGSKCIYIVLAIPNDTDLDKTKTILHDILQADDRILKYPMPDISFQDFSGNNITIKISFWVRFFKLGVSSKSDLIEIIKTVFQKNGILIPPEKIISPVTISSPAAVPLAADGKNTIT